MNISVTNVLDMHLTEEISVIEWCICDKKNCDFSTDG